MENISRSEKRAQDRKSQKMAKKMNKFTPEQQLIVDALVARRATEIVTDVATTINTCYYNAMRENKISEARATIILKRTQELIGIENEKYMEGK